jgi:response regulator of citrate/malate metabolism
MVGSSLSRYIKFKSEIDKIMIYIVSSSNNPDDVIQKSIFEVTDYLIKPINRDTYASILNSFFDYNHCCTTKKHDYFCSFIS